VETLTPDLCVIGAGSAGLSVAAIAASFGVPVVLVERGRMGGECLNVGCVPSKALIAAAESRHAALSAGAFGVEAGRPEADFARVREHVRMTIAAIEPNDSAERFTAMGVRVIAAEARFTGPDAVAAGGHLIRARRFVIATGSRPAIPPIPGLEAVPVLTNETVFDLAERPRRLLVIGGGPIGIELAQAHRRLGAEVTVVEAAPRILAREDPEMAAVVERALLREGVELRVGASIARVEPRPEGVAIVLGSGGSEEALEGSHLLVAAGRRPSTEGLGLKAAGIAVDKAGIVVDRGLRTANRRVYAIGDCAGGAVAPYRFTHVSNYHAGLVVRSALFRLPVRVSTTAIARVTFTDPELAAVGLSEEEARARHRTIRILRWPFAENDRAQAERRIAGHVKAIVTPRGRILGCAIAGPQAGELIVPWALAVRRGLKAQDLAGLVFPYPTLSEVTKRAAVEFLRPAAQNPWLRRLIGVARRFG
jgi:pyruvate/2-oxoglutarate dehydrogenase complex dihydrolipoamide dehydrogenase (E3) component